ncbi:hypothetical protein E4631_12550 [Hymenobacter sp. UV11]|uniref:hypothetical protein n=1 Tax=Hymenobacter sp. UV11 TaxID=1849735 RepID=UPI001061FC98|nr:hypothetical protein [Hymenobacter sp. UV11]TDN38991.1 hypothetical protein A8B98_21055 [Hymenobacter sp. UV11]TFZ65926.1 hypothetical protein E4631_12550 [Hymenobacter sp. UV11]
MRKLSFISLLGGLLSQAYPALAQQAAKPVYLQIFYEGSGWLSGQRVLSYSPAFRGKVEELVAEPDSIRQVSPNAHMERPTDLGTTSYTTVTTEKGTVVPDRNGKVHFQTAAEYKLAQQQEKVLLNRSFRLLQMRGDLARITLSKALNDAAAEGWEVVQMTSWGSQGSLVYLLRRR